MPFTNEEIAEFKVEAKELLDGAEEALLAIDAGGGFKERYDAIFRAFHSLKGAAGMMELNRLQEHMHQVEARLMQIKDFASISSEHADYFLKGVDAARQILDGKEVVFSYETEGAPKPKPEAAIVSIVPIDPKFPSNSGEIDPVDLANRAIDLLLFQYYNLDQFLVETGQIEIRNTVRGRLKELLNDQAKLPVKNKRAS